MGASADHKRWHVTQTQTGRSGVDRTYILRVHVVRLTACMKD